MSLGNKRCIQMLATGVFMVLFALPGALLAETPHVVNPADLQNSAVNASQTRQQNIQKVRKFLSTEIAQKELKSAHIDAKQVKEGVSRLSDQELAQLASRTDKAQADFAAGYLDNRDIVLIVLGVVVIILIVVVAS